MEMLLAIKKKALLPNMKIPRDDTIRGALFISYHIEVYWPQQVFDGVIRWISQSNVQAITQ